MHFIRLSLLGLVTAALGASAQAQGGGANRMIMADGAGGWIASPDNLTNPAGVNGFDLIVAGEFGFGEGDEIYLLARDGTNRFLVKTSEGIWATASDGALSTGAVNGYDMAVAGDFGFGDGDEIFFLARNGSSRFAFRNPDGAWAATGGEAINPAAVNGFDMIVAGDFGFGEGDEIYLLAKNGSNRFMFRDPDGIWTATSGDALNPAGVNGFDLLAAGDLGYGEGDEIYLLARDGTNRLLIRTSEGLWASTDDAVMSPGAVNGFEMAVTGDFGFGDGNEIFLLARDGSNRFVFRNPDGAWAATEGEAIDARAVNGYTRAVSGAFGGGSGSAIFLLE